MVDIFTPGQTLDIKKGDTCLLCGKGTMVERENKVTKLQFLGCTNYPRCNNTVTTEFSKFLSK